MKLPILSIIIPVYNASSFIYNIVNSILSQGFRDFELILVNDGSTDDTELVLTKLSQKDERIFVVNQHNCGPSSARNTGLEIAKGKYVQFFDADDNITSDALSEIITSIEKDGSDMVVSGWQIDLWVKNKLIENYESTCPKEAFIVSDIQKFVLESIGNDGTLYNLWNKLFRADIIRDNNIRFREDLRFGEDLIFALHYFCWVKSIKIIPNVTYRYQANSSSSVFNKSALVPGFRKTNDEELVSYAGNSNKDLLEWVRWRWLLSFWMLISKSSLHRRDKIKTIKKFTPKNITVSNRSKQIGTKKILLEKIARYLLRHPRLALFFSQLLNITKSVIKFIKLKMGH